jgi:hypothetical protein
MAGKTWIDDVKLKRGALREQLHVPKGKPIPTKMLKDIVDAGVGGRVTVKNGAKSYPMPINRRLIQRAGMALTLKRMWHPNQK